MSPCALSDLTAGPLLLFKSFIWSNVLSATLPIYPPSASISLTTIPFAEPPIDGLHGIIAIVSFEPVTSNVLWPLLAEASVASHPACPPPTTIISYFILINLLFCTCIILQD